MALVPSTPKPDISVVGDDLFCVLSNTETLGYVHKIGGLYVALAGDNLGHAVEVGQSMSWDNAIRMVVNY